MTKKILFFSPFIFLSALLLFLAAAPSASNAAPAPAPSEPQTVIGGGQWERIWQGRGALHDFDCATPDFCFAVGEGGMALKTVDGGQTWHQDLLDGGQNLLSVSTDGPVVLVSGEGGVIYRSIDGGNVWEQVQTPTGADLEAITLLADGSNAWAVGADGVILHSATGGTTWNAQASGVSLTLHAVQFLDAQTGYAAGEKGTLLKTNNGGDDWTPISGAFPGWASINALSFIDADSGWVAGQAGYVRKTTDGGQTWQAIDSGVGVDIFSIHIQNGFGALGGAKGVVATSDNGVEWTTRASIATDDRDVNAVFVQDGQNVWAAGTIKSGSAWAWFIDHSSNGIDFFPVAGDYGADPILQEVAAPSKKVAYVVGHGGAIGKTIDGGDTWAWQHFESLYPNAPRIAAISCPTVDDCWIAGQVSLNPGFVYVTHDGGETWTFQRMSSGANWPWMYDIVMLDADNGHAAANPDMFYTTDGGQTWNKSTVVGSTANVEISMASPYEGWTVQRNLGRRYTTNGGKTWNRFMPYSEQNNVYFFGVDALDVDQDGGLDMGWQVGCQGPLVDEQCPANSGVIFYAVGDQDPGYRQSLPENTPQLFTINMLDDQHGWVGGAEGTLLYTDNGGARWQRVESHTSSLITDIALYKDKIGYAATYGGEILRFQSPGRGLNSYSQATPITVDGDIYDWNYGGKLHLDADNASTVLGEEPYPGPDQLSGEFYSRWTDDTLYIMAQIAGDERIQYASVMLALDGLNDDAWDPENNDDDLQIFIAANGDFESGSPNNNAAIAHAIKFADNHWQLELGIPATLLGRDNLAENDAVGVNLALGSSDEDGGNMHILLLSGRNLTGAPATWGDIHLLGDALTLQNGRNEYDGAEDAYISVWENDSTVNHGGDDLLHTIFTSGTRYSNTLIRFDLSALPEMAHTGTARLKMYVASSYAREGFQVAAFRLLRPWDESAATWIMADETTPWAAQGAMKAGEDYDTPPLDTVDIPINFKNDWLTWDISDAVSYWRQHPDENYGILLMGVNASQRVYTYSSEYNAMPEQRPQLQVDFSLQPRPTPTPTPTPTPMGLYLPLIQR